MKAPLDIFLRGSVVTQKTFKASDGKIFLTANELSDYLQRQNLSRFLEYHRVGRGGEWDVNMVEDFLLDNRVDVIEVLGGHDNGWGGTE